MIILKGTGAALAPCQHCLQMVGCAALQEVGLADDVVAQLQDCQGSWSGGGGLCSIRRRLPRQASCGKHWYKLVQDMHEVLSVCISVSAHHFCHALVHSFPGMLACGQTALV